MKVFKKVLLAAAACTAMVSAQASPITVGGVTWDPDYATNSELDFIAEFQFTQWYTNTISTVDNIGNYAAAKTIGYVLTTMASSGTGATGLYLQGVGEVTKINENNGFGTFTSSTNELTYAFGGIGLNGNGSFDITNAWARLHVNSISPNYSTGADSQAEVNDAQSGSTWLDFTFASLAFEDGSVQNGLVSAVLNIVGGDASYNFVPNTLVYSADAQFGLATTKYSSGGNGSVIGNSVPEPSSLALLGLGLLGVGLARRKANTK